MYVIVDSFFVCKVLKLWGKKRFIYCRHNSNVKIISFGRQIVHITLVTGIYLRSHGVQHICRIRSHLFDHRVQMSVLVFQQIVRMIELDHSARVHNEHSVAVHDGVQAVSDRQHGTLFEYASDRLLDQRVGPAANINDR